MFSISADPRDGFPRDPSLIISFLSVEGFTVLITVSCGEDVDEASEDEVEELVDRPRTTNGTYQAHGNYYRTDSGKVKICIFKKNQRSPNVYLYSKIIRTTGNLYL